MARGRVLLVVLLVYLGLDLSLPAMPGIFILDPAGSVETLDVARARLTTDIVALVAPAADDALSLAQPPRVDARRRLPSNGDIARPERRLVNCRARARCVSPRPPGEDPH